MHAKTEFIYTHQTTASLGIQGSNLLANAHANH